MQNTAWIAAQNVPVDLRFPQAQDRNRLYADIVRNMPVALSVWRLEKLDDVRSFTLLHSNLEARRVSGGLLEKYYGRPMLKSFPALLKTEVPEILRHVILSGQTSDWVEIAGAGEDLPEDISSAKAFPLPHRCVGVLFRNVAEHKKLRETIENQAYLLDLVDDAILVRTLDGTPSSWNKGAERMYGWTTKEALGESAGWLLEAQFPSPLGQVKEALAREGRWEGELVHTKRDGAPIIVASKCILQRDKNGAPFRWIQFNRDVTDNRKAQDAIREAEASARRTSEITVLSQMSSLLQTCVTAKEAYAVIAQYGSKLFPSESGVLGVLSASRNIVEAVATWGHIPSGGQVFAPDDCWALRSGRAHVVENPGSAVACRHVVESGALSYVCVPLVAQGDAWGVLHLVNRPDAQAQPEAASVERLEPSRQELAVTMAEQISLALANLKLRDSLRTKSLRDLLTGLFNRRYMEESFALELRRAARKQGRLGIILLDLDHFKEYNDTLGHEAGDNLLRELGSFLQGQIRSEDVACRYGGDEFIIILPDASLDIS